MAERRVSIRSRVHVYSITRPASSCDPPSLRKESRPRFREPGPLVRVSFRNPFLLLRLLWPCAVEECQALSHLLESDVVGGVPAIALNGVRSDLGAVFACPNTSTLMVVVLGSACPINLSICCSHVMPARDYSLRACPDALTLRANTPKAATRIVGDHPQKPLPCLFIFDISLRNVAASAGETAKWYWDPGVVDTKAHSSVCIFVLCL